MANHLTVPAGRCADRLHVLVDFQPDGRRLAEQLFDYGELDPFGVILLQTEDFEIGSSRGLLQVVFHAQLDTLKENT